MMSQLNPKVMLSVELTNVRDVLKVTSVAPVELAKSYSTLVPFSINSNTYLLAYSPEQTACDVYLFNEGNGSLKPTTAQLAVGGGKNIINVFTLGNRPYLCAYTAQDGVFTTYAILDDLSLSKPYVFYRNHELAISKGFSTVKFFSQLGQVVFLGYNKTTGYVAMYTASITPISPNPGDLPLLMLPIWSHPWAPGWVRFAFFQFGGENFFLKTNISNPQNVNVNIDHVFDMPTAGTAEVGTRLNLVKALDLTSVEPFSLGADPYFSTYISGTGELTLYRFHSDCQGWTSVARFDGPPGATVMTPVRASDSRVFLFLS